MSTLPQVTEGPETGRPLSGRRIALIVTAVIALLVAVGFVAYAAGEHGRHRLTVLTGNAHVGENEASIPVGGWVYGVQDSVPWMDTNGGYHEGGWPSCLATVSSTVRVTFGEIAISGPAGVGDRRAVVWVDCRGAIPVH